MNSNINRGSNPGSVINRGPGPGRPTANSPLANRNISREVRLPNNTVAAFRPDGSPRFVRANGMTIVHGPAGQRQIALERPDHTAVVANAVGHGYVQRPFAYRNVTFINRTYYVHGTAYTRIYRPYVYRGVTLNRYVPARYYSPTFYNWVYTPWRAPVSYRWVWVGRPWTVYYGPYFAPAPVYPSASLWLADYLVSSTLETAYQDRVDNNPAPLTNYPAPSQGTPAVTTTAITPEVKQAIAAEVERQIAFEKSEGQLTTPGVAPDPAQTSLPAELNDNNSHAFVVAVTLNVTSTDGQECSVTEGDVLQLNGPPPDNSAGADVMVLASKDRDCRQGSTITVGIQDLQEMQNQMRALVDQGMGELQAHGNGLPSPPADASGGVTTASFISTAPGADPNAAVEIRQELQQASEMEKQVLAQAKAADSAGPVAQNGPGSSPPTIALNQSINQIVAIKGYPNQIANVGTKQIYVYSDMKIIFTNGKVSDVQDVQ